MPAALLRRCCRLSEPLLPQCHPLQSISHDPCPHVPCSHFGPSFSVAVSTLPSCELDASLTLSLSRPSCEMLMQLPCRVRASEGCTSVIVSDVTTSPRHGVAPPSEGRGKGDEGTGAALLPETVDGRFPSFLGCFQQLRFPQQTQFLFCFVYARAQAPHGKPTSAHHACQVIERPEDRPFWVGFRTRVPQLCHCSTSRQRMDLCPAG